MSDIITTDQLLAMAEAKQRAAPNAELAAAIAEFRASLAEQKAVINDYWALVRKALATMLACVPATERRRVLAKAIRSWITSFEKQVMERLRGPSLDLDALKATLARELQAHWPHTAHAQAAPSAGVTIKADNVAVDGMQDVANMVKQLDKTLRMPVIPIFDKSGMLKGSRRVARIEGVPPDEAPAADSAVLTALEARLKMLEARPSTNYRGTWSAGMQCQAGDWVTHSGTLWHCRESTRDKPGTSDAFQLAVKQPR